MKTTKIPQKVITKLNRDLAKFLPEEIVVPKADQSGKFQRARQGGRLRKGQKRLVYMGNTDVSIVKPIGLSNFTEEDNIPVGYFRDQLDRFHPLDQIKNFWAEQRAALIKGVIKLKNEYVDDPHMEMTGFSIEMSATPGVTLNFEFK